MLDDHVAVALAGDNQFPSIDQRGLHSSAFAVNGILDAAIAHERWAELLYWGTQLSNIEASKTRTQYWLARAKQQQGEPHSFADLATHRDYYGFLAAAQIRADAELQAAPPRQLTRKNEARLLAIPGIARAVELFAVGDDLNARREWYRTIEPVSYTHLTLPTNVAV